MRDKNSVATSSSAERATDGVVRSAVQHSSGPIGGAVFVSLLAALAWILALKGWVERHDAPSPTTLLITILALGFWRPVRVPGREATLKYFRTARMVLLAVIALIAAVGIYRWSWHGVAIAIPVLAAWNLVLEVWYPRYARRPSTAERTGT